MPPRGAACTNCRKKPVRIELAKVLKPFGVRVQKSVFECWLSSAGLKTLLERMDEIIDPKIDSVRCYPLCESCRYLACTQGLTECKEPKNTFII